MKWIFKNIGKAGMWLADRTFGTYLALLLIGGVGGTAAFAAQTYDVHNVPDMVLYTGMNTTETVGIKVAWPYRNNIRYPFPGSGGVLEIRRGDAVEHIYFSDVENDSVNKLFTLTGTVIRDLSWNDCSQYVSNGAGKTWARGNAVRLVDDCRLFNFSIKKDRQNEITADLGISFTGSGSIGIPTFATTAERDQQLGAAPDGLPVKFACVTGTAFCYMGMGGTWITIGNTGVGSATTTTSGVSELATLADLLNGTLTGNSTAPLFVPPSLFTRSSTGSTQAGKAMLLGSNGYASGSLLGSGARSAATFLAGDQTWKDVNDSIIHPVFGNAIDGNKTLSGTLTLTRDMFWDTLDLAGNTINNAGYRIFALRITDSIGGGKIKAATGGSGGNGTNGSNASGGTGGNGGAAGSAGAAVTGQTLPDSAAGVAGGAGGAGGTSGVSAGTAGPGGTSGVASTKCIGTQAGATGGNSGAGGDGSQGSGGGGAGGIVGGGGSGGACTSHGRAEIDQYTKFIVNKGTTFSQLTGAGGGGAGAGGGGGGNATSAGGGGGGGGGGSGGNGGYFLVVAYVIDGNWTIESLGGAGGNGAQGGAGTDTTQDGGGGGGGGTGAGGSGGSGILIYHTNTSWTGSAVLTGGAAGVTVGLGGSGPGAAADGSVGSLGSAGATGILLSIQL